MVLYGNQYGAAMAAMTALDKVKIERINHTQDDIFEYLDTDNNWEMIVALQKFDRVRTRVGEVDVERIAGYAICTQPCPIEKTIHVIEMKLKPIPGLMKKFMAFAERYCADKGARGITMTSTRSEKAWGRLGFKAIAKYYEKTFGDES